MNNDLEQFSEERLEEISDASMWVRVSYEEVESLARIVLSVKQAKPTFKEWLSSRTDTIDVDCGCVTTEAFYHWLKVAYEATPQPAHTEQVIPSEIPKVPHNGVMSYKKDGSIYSTNYARGWNDCVKAMLAATPKHDVSLINEGNKNDSCQWNRDEDLVYSTSCGNEWQFTDGGLEDNQIKFCPYCSGKISAPKPESE